VLAARLGRLHGVGQVEPLAGDAVRVHTCAPGATEGVLRALVAAGVTDVATGRPSLEEVYLRVMAGRGLVV
jgi:ABC-2 type transport system ATP-binding protein